MDIQQIYNRFLKCNSVCTDTRKTQPNCMFFALKGDNFNGNKFVNSAAKSGAKYCVIDDAAYHIEGKTILVDNVLSTLQHLAKHHRTQLSIPIIALTGSNGKTTTKELIDAILSKQFNTTATKGNFNNHIGVPLTLLSMTNNTEIGIVEMGANHKKEIEFLCSIASPDYGLITNFGKAHLEGFGNLQGVIEGKTELYDYLKQHKKIIFVNDNDDLQKEQIKGYSSIYKFGTSIDNDTRVQLKEVHPFVTVQYKNRVIKSQLIGNYNFNNISVAIAIADYFNINTDNIAKAIETYIPDNNRSQIIQKQTNKILLDAYNANPTSMIAALDNFKQLEEKNKILFLGDMFELGENSALEHQNIINYLEEHYTAPIYVIGHNFYNTKITKANIKAYPIFEDLKEEFQNETFSNTCMLIKGSRGMALERILDML